jgi:hypothetical protein
MLTIFSNISLKDLVAVVVEVLEWDSVIRMMNFYLAFSDSVNKDQVVKAGNKIALSICLMVMTTTWMISLVKVLKAVQAVEDLVVFQAVALAEVAVASLRQVCLNQQLQSK